MLEMNESVKLDTASTLRGCFYKGRAIGVVVPVVTASIIPIMRNQNNELQFSVKKGLPSRMRFDCDVESSRTILG